LIRGLGEVLGVAHDHPHPLGRGHQNTANGLGVPLLFEQVRQADEVGRDPLLRFIEECQGEAPVTAGEGRRKFSEAVGEQIEGDGLGGQFRHDRHLLGIWRRWAAANLSFHPATDSLFRTTPGTLADDFGTLAALMTLGAVAYGLLVLA
jgi:hypothetical protein